ncbi:MAG: HEAT repeat protein [Gammaproteobacteria bacterium]|jgi:HEAT repeat protein
MRQTPYWAYLLAPIVVLAIAMLFSSVLGPLYVSIRYSETVIVFQMRSETPKTRLAALRNISRIDTPSAELADELVSFTNTDSSNEVRRAAITALGHLGSKQALSGLATGTLHETLLTSDDNAILDAAVVAVGESASKNRYNEALMLQLAVMISEKRQSWLHSRVSRTLGQIGARQALPNEMFEQLNSFVKDPENEIRNNPAVGALSEIGATSALPIASLEILADVFETDSNLYVRIAIIKALANNVAGFARSVELIRTATNSTDRQLVSAAEVALRGIESDNTFRGREPLELAVDTTEGAKARLSALQMLRSTPIESGDYAAIVALARDPDIDVAVAAIGIFRRLAATPSVPFDRDVLLPQIEWATVHTDAKIRTAAFSSLSTIAVHRRNYPHAPRVATMLDRGASDPDATVRSTVLATSLRAARDGTQGERYLRRGLSDPNPEVRKNIVYWLFSEKTKTRHRQDLIELTLQDTDQSVREAALLEQKKSRSRQSPWWSEIAREWQTGEHTRAALAIATLVTLAAPVFVGGGFLLYFAARFLTYLRQRRWRAVAIVPIVTIWCAACYGMFLLYFIAGHSGNTDVGETAQLIALLWLALGVFTLLGFGLRFFVRR